VSNTLTEQYLEDARKHEGFREYAYPDPLSYLAKRYKHLPWGFKPARELLNLIREPESKGPQVYQRDGGTQTKGGDPSIDH
jgi:hypothetical protein